MAQAAQAEQQLKRIELELGCSGAVAVHLHRGRGLKSMDRNGFSDPYVKLSLGRERVTSKTISKTLDPAWDETFEFHGPLRCAPA